LVTFCAEYDALPEIGHGCGHNLIAVSSIALFLGAVAVLRDTKMPGRVRLLGCPAEDGGAGKVKLINMGAFSETDAALMSHLTPHFGHIPASLAGVAYGTCLAAGGSSAHFIESQRMQPRGPGLGSTHSMRYHWRILRWVCSDSTSGPATVSISFYRRVVRPTTLSFHHITSSHKRNG
jgi:hypothetical protein